MKLRVHSKLGEYLNDRGIKQSWLADQIGATRTQVSNWCKNVNGEAFSTPSVGFLLRMKDVLDCKLEDLYEVIE